MSESDPKKTYKLKAKILIKEKEKYLKLNPKPITSQNNLNNIIVKRQQKSFQGKIPTEINATSLHDNRVKTPIRQGKRNNEQLPLIQTKSNILYKMETPPRSKTPSNLNGGIMLKHNSFHYQIFGEKNNNNSPHNKINIFRHLPSNNNSNKNSIFNENFNTKQNLQIILSLKKKLIEKNKECSELQEKLSYYNQSKTSTLLKELEVENKILILELEKTKKTFCLKSENEKAKLEELILLNKYKSANEEWENKALLLTQEIESLNNAQKINNSNEIIDTLKAENTRLINENTLLKQCIVIRENKTDFKELALENIINSGENNIYLPHSLTRKEFEEWCNLLHIIMFSRNIHIEPDNWPYDNLTTFTEQLYLTLFNNINNTTKEEDLRTLYRFCYEMSLNHGKVDYVNFKTKFFVFINYQDKFINQEEDDENKIERNSIVIGDLLTKCNLVNKQKNGIITFNVFKELFFSESDNSELLQHCLKQMKKEAMLGLYMLNYNELAHYILIKGKDKLLNDLEGLDWEDKESENEEVKKSTKKDIIEEIKQEDNNEKYKENSMSWGNREVRSDIVAEGKAEEHQNEEVICGTKKNKKEMNVGEFEGKKYDQSSNKSLNEITEKKTRNKIQGNISFNEITPLNNSIEVKYKTDSSKLCTELFDYARSQVQIRYFDPYNIARIFCDEIFEKVLKIHFEEIFSVSNQIKYKTNNLPKNVSWNEIDKLEQEIINIKSEKREVKDMEDNNCKSRKIFQEDDDIFGDKAENNKMWITSNLKLTNSEFDVEN